MCGQQRITRGLNMYMGGINCGLMERVKRVEGGFAKLVKILPGIDLHVFTI